MIIGNLGANAEVKKTGKGEFLTMRVAHNDEWTDDQGLKHSVTNWVDAVMSCRNGVPKVAQYLVAGQLVYVTGSVSLRVYSSQKDRCMKPGLTINVRDIQLLGGKSDTVPSQLADINGMIHDVTKLYWVCDVTDCVLQDSRCNNYTVDKHGFIKP